MRHPLSQAEDRQIVIGIGNAIRGADSLGLLAAQKVQGVPYRCCDPVDIIDGLSDFEDVVIIDAALGPEPGQVHTWTLEELLERDVSGAGFNHVMGLPDALKFAQAMDHLPKRLWIVTIGAPDARWGELRDEDAKIASSKAARIAEALLGVKGGPDPG